VLCDVTVVHQLGAGYLASAARNSGYAVRVAQKAKYNKYPALKNCTQALFMPLAMETYGLGGASGRAQLGAVPRGLRE
jgi:hypothetical protein